MTRKKSTQASASHRAITQRLGIAQQMVKKQKQMRPKKQKRPLIKPITLEMKSTYKIDTKRKEKSWMKNLMIIFERVLVRNN